MQHDPHLHAKLDFGNNRQNEIGWRLLALHLTELAVNTAIRTAWLAGATYAFIAIFEKISKHY